MNAYVFGKPVVASRVGSLPEYVRDGVTGLLVMLVLVFMLPWWNRFLAVRTGHGVFLAAQSFELGKVPYRDYFMPVPPLQFLKSYWVLQAFGWSLTTPLVWALFERCLLALLMAAALPAGAQVGLGLTPMRLEFRLAAGQQTSGTLDLSNWNAPTISNAGAGKKSRLGALLARLAPRWFVARGAGGADLTLLNPRWTMSYLRGPMTPQELRRARTPAPTPPAPPMESPATNVPFDTSALGT